MNLEMITPSNLALAAANFRALADAIEAGDFGPDPECAIAIDGDKTFQVYAVGVAEHDTAKVVGLLHSGAIRVVIDSIPSNEEDQH